MRTLILILAVLLIGCCPEAFPPEKSRMLPGANIDRPVPPPERYSPLNDRRIGTGGL